MEADAKQPRKDPAAGACALCSKPLPEGAPGTLVNGSLLCDACVAQVQSELAQEAPDAMTLPRAAIGGLAGGMAGGAGWAAITIATNIEIGYVAIGVGFLAGLGVSWASGGKKGMTLQVVAAACAMLGLVLGKYLIFAHAVIESQKRKDPELAATLGYFTPRIIEIFVANLTSFASPFDILWVVLAVAAAWRMPAATEVRVD